MRRYPVFLLLLASMFIGTVSADTLITTRRSQTLLGENAPAPVEQTTKTWLGDGQLREENPGGAIIVDEKAKKVYWVKDAIKGYHEFDLPFDFLKLVPEDSVQQYQQMLDLHDMQVDIQDSDEKRKIGKYDARKHIVEMNGFERQQRMELWVTDDVGFDVAAKKRLTLILASLQPGASQWIGKVLAIEGYPVLRTTEASRGGMKVEVREELVSVETVASDEARFRPPGDYEQKPFNLLTMMPSSN